MTWQRGSGRTQESARIPALSGSLVACPVCHDALCSPSAVLVLDVSEKGQKLLALLFPQLAGLRVHRVEDTGNAVVISSSCTASSECCPACGSASARVHGGYSRTVADGAAGGRPVLIIVRVLRFLCVNPSCPKVTFAVQADGLTSRYCRRSVPLTRMLTGLGLELAGRAGARLAGTLGIAVHSSTILRLLAGLPDREAGPAPEILGIDDFALRKGHVYGTVLVSMETGDVVDLLPDRLAATVETWLKAHPGATVICRDRAGAYAGGARAGAPGAIQVADRWHLWHNLAEYAEKTAGRHRGCLLAAGHGTQAGDDQEGKEEGEASSREPCPEPEDQAPPDGFLDACGRERRLVTRTRERYADIRARLDESQSLSAISRATGLDRKTVQRFARAQGIDELLVRAVTREAKTGEFKPYLCQRWNDGVRDASVLHAELRQRGRAGSVQTVRRYLAPFRKTDAAPEPPPPAPKTRQITRLLLTRPDHLQPDKQAQLAGIRAQCPHLNSLAGHITAFAEMMADLTGSTGLDTSLAAVEADDQPGLRSFATGIRNDKEAVLNGLTLPYNSGRVEGTVNKIKMIKRQMYGRAGFSLLRKRVILHLA
ncbi:MAG TPA: ISL3 family transposase [Streptosporangiaceae bacterium]|nr:ISL3 family transposase [Streptosporangiaceae bacterium]